MAPRITWFGHSSFALTDDRVTVYIDPWKLPPSALQADIICITHEHFDHCSPDDIRLIAKPKTDIVAPSICADKFSTEHFHIIAPGQRLELRGLVIEAVPAYNTNKKFHPVDAHQVGYIISIGEQRVYHAGDTDLIPEMQNIKADIAILPISGTYVMTAAEAAEAAKRIHPTIVVPMHYGSIVGSNQDVEQFKQLVPGDIRVKVFPKTVS
jgi:L-ascorbate metabolism protein UlaG (beta-lactamase superfamily)